KVPSFAEEMTFRAAADQDSIFYPPVAWLLRVRLPARQILAVEELHPAVGHFPLEGLFVSRGKGNELAAIELAFFRAADFILARRRLEVVDGSAPGSERRWRGFGAGPHLDGQVGIVGDNCQMGESRVRGRRQQMPHYHGG